MIAILVIPMIIFSYRELKEPPEQRGAQSPSPSFNESLGGNFAIGAYTKIVKQESSGGMEANCENLQTIIIGTLHDIKKRLEHMNSYNSTEDTFEVNAAALQLFCNKNATITLADKDGNTLVLQKSPFARVVPQGGAPEDIGTDVRINATLVPLGAPMPVRPTTYGDVLIPDRFLDEAATSSR